jgi:hypothetical protein
MIDKDLADLLGTAPAKGPDPAFRYDVLARAAAHASRQAARARALRYAGVLTLIGLVGAGLQAMGAGGPALAAAGVSALIYCFALAAIDGPKRAIERSRALLHAGL